MRCSRSSIVEPFDESLVIDQGSYLVHSAHLLVPLHRSGKILDASDNALQAATSRSAESYVGFFDVDPRRHPISTN